MSEKPSKFSQEQNEPLFMAIATKDASFKEAYELASQTLHQFIKYIQSGSQAYFSAKLRFCDPDESERLGEDKFFFMWLTNVQYHPEKQIFAGTFFEVPLEIQKWHKVGDRLGFAGEDIFDWMVLSPEGRLFGGYTLRVTRSKLPEHERADYDRFIGVREYVK